MFAAHFLSVGCPRATHEFTCGGKLKGLHWLRVGNHQRRQCVRLKRFIIEVLLFEVVAVKIESLWSHLASFIVDKK